jgi:D-alanyl-D-alanine carboxypeptidase (penicillin-binding protein 5/6)
MIIWNCHRLGALSLMQHFIKSFVFFCLSLGINLVYSSSSLADIHALPQPTLMIPAPPQLAAKAYLLIDYLSDYVIAEQDVDQRVEPASLTKMMTVYAVDHAIKNGKLKLNDLVQISEKAWKSEGTRMFVDVHSKVPVIDLLRGIIIQSGNDASVALAEQIAGSETTFAQLMNQYAKQLGMVNTHFTNATGLPDPNHYTTARDMAILAKALIRDFPETYQIYAQKEFLYHDIKQENRNRLLWRNELVDGIKTGHTDSAGYCLVASGKKENMRLIAVVMGTKSDGARTEETNKLLMYGFQFYETRKLYPAGTALKKARIWMGTEKEVELGLADDLYVTIGHGQYDHLKSAIQVAPGIKAPAEIGTTLGTVTVQMNDKTLVERPIVALNTVAESGFFSQIFDTLLLNISSLWEKASA